MTTPLRTHILFAGLLWAALLFAAPPAANAGQIIGAPTYIGLNSGLVGYWSFDGKDGAGNVAYDRSGQGNHGTLTNGPARSIGKIGQALEFDQIDDYVDLGTMDVAGSAMTISTWVYRRAVPSTADCFANDDCRIIDKSVGTGEQSIYWMISTIWDGSKAVLRARLSTSGNTDTLIATSGEVKDGEWTHAVMRYDGSTLKLYKDTVEVGSMSKTGAIDTSAAVSAFIGASAVESLNWWGKIDDVRIYNRALSPDEIKRLYKIGATAKFGVANSSGSLSSGLVGWWTFDGNDIAGTKAYDRSGYGKTGTLTNAPKKVIGKIGQALDFDGTATYVDMGIQSIWNNIGPLTYSTWIYPRTSGGGGYGRIISKAAGGSSYKDFDLNNVEVTNGLMFYVTLSPTPLQAITTANSIVTGQWQHVAVTWDGSVNRSGVNFYVNGQLISQSGGADGSGTLDDNDNLNLLIGDRGDGTRVFDGPIDDVRIYNRELSTDEIKRLYKIGATMKVGIASKNVNSANLYGLWSFDGKEVAGSDALTIYDRGAQGDTDNGD